MRRDSWVDAAGPVLVLAALMTVAVTLRVLVLDVPGHGGDLIVQSRWAERMAEFGPWDFYTRAGSVYPALLYPYWALGALLDGEQLTLAIKALSIPFDLVLAAVLADVIAARAGAWRGVAGAALYLFNPAVLLAGPVWGQVDAAGTIFLLWALVALADGRHALAGGLTVIATAFKPQFGLALLPVAVLAWLDWRRAGSARTAALAFFGMGVAYVLVTFSLDLGPRTWLSQMTGAVAFSPLTSRYAPNLWGLLVGFDIDDAPYALVGTTLLLIGLAASVVPLWRRRDLGTVLGVGLVLVFALYFLPTRVHERYLFPAMALAVPLAVVSSRALLAYVTLSMGFALSLLHALAATTPFQLPEPYQSAVLSPMAIWVAGLSMLAAAASLTLLTRQDPEMLDRLASAPRG